MAGSDDVVRIDSMIARSEQRALLNVIRYSGRRRKMLRRLLITLAATLVLAVVAAAPERAAAHWLGTPNAIAGSDVQGGPSDLLQVRRWRHGYWWWGVPFVAAPLLWAPRYYAYDRGYYAYDRGCGWARVRYVTPNGHVRHKRVWTCP
jgi:hypothetical protein